MTTIDLFGPGAQFDHVGLAVRSIREALGEEVAVVADTTQRVGIAFADWDGVRTELIEPLGADSPIRASLQQGRPLVHLCFQVPDLERAVAAGRRRGARRLTRAVPAPALGGRRIVWLFHAIFGVIELVEAAPAAATAASDQ